MVDYSAKAGLAKRMQVRQIRKTMESALAANEDMEAVFSETITEYLRTNGVILCVTADSAFSETVHEIICTGLGLPEESIEVSSSADLLLLSVRQAISAKKEPLLLIELNVMDRDMTYLVRQLKNAFPEMRIIIVTQESSEQRMSLLHASGVDNCLVKPVDTGNVLETLALTIKPYEQQSRALKWASILLAQGEYLQALQVCKKALGSAGSSAQALLLIGDIFRAMKQYDKACEAYENASKVSSAFVEPLLRQAEVYAETGNMRKRLRVLERADQLSPSDIARKLEIGKLYLQFNLDDNAKQFFDRAISLSKRQASDHVAKVSFKVAEVYMDKDPDTAASFMQKGLEAKRAFWDKEDIFRFNQLGMLLRRAGKNHEAVEEYRKAIEISPNDENLYYNLALAHADSKDYESARAACLKALALNPDMPGESAQVAINISSIFVKTGDNVHALPLLRKALALDPNNAAAKEMLAQVEKGKKDGQKGA